MNKEEKFKAIIDRLGEIAKDFKPIHISVMVIMDYMNTLFKDGIINEGEVQITSVGTDAVSLCTEFDWKPTDAEIVSFCKDMVEEESLQPFVMMLINMRDDRENFLKNAKKQVGY